MIYIATKKQLTDSHQHNTLQFQESDRLCLLEKSNEWWWLVINKYGDIGYAQVSFLSSYQNDDADINDTAFMFIEEAIKKLSSSNLNDDHHVNMLSLLYEKKKEVTLLISRSKSTKVKKRQAPMPPPIPERVNTPTSHSNDKSSTLVATKSNDSTSICNLKKDDSNSVGRTETDRSILAKDIYLPNTVAYDLIKSVKDSAKVSDACCVDTLKGVFTCLKINMPHITREMDAVIESLNSARISKTKTNVEKMRLLFCELSRFASDEEQSNLAVADSKDVLILLNDIMSLLADESNEKDNIAFLSEENFTSVFILIKYIQMESRIDVRNSLFETASLICGMSKNFVSYMLSSILPCELIRDIADHINDGDRNALPTILLTMILSSEEPYPISVKDALDKEFLRLLLSQIEKETDERLEEVYFHLLLSVNLSYLIPEENLIMDVIAESNFTKTSERAIYTFNRGDDPIAFTAFESHMKNPHSVVKFFVDVFSNSNSSGKFLYTNDFYVLVDVLSRNINDLQPGSKLRTEYLDLFLNIVTHKIYKDSRYRWKELREILLRIQNEEDSSELAQFDKLIILKILSDM